MILYDHRWTIHLSLFGLSYHIIIGMIPNKELICINLICIIYLRWHVRLADCFDDAKHGRCTSYLVNGRLKSKSFMYLFYS